jgi:hypothetical protein
MVVPPDRISTTYRYDILFLCRLSIAMIATPLHSRMTSSYTKSRCYYLIFIVASHIAMLLFKRHECREL